MGGRGTPLNLPCEFYQQPGNLMEKEPFFTKQPESKGGGRRVPRVGDRIVFSGWRLEALEMDGRHVDKVRANPEPAAEA
jgi:hypothetical protein